MQLTMTNMIIVFQTLLHSNSLIMPIDPDLELIIIQT